MIAVSDLAERMLGKQVRKGRPVSIAGLAEAVSGPAFSSVIGMLHHVRHRSWEEEILSAAQARKGWLPERIVKWFRENF